ncbi:MAG: c-type cytochrome [Geminicoccaceae bacterium]
MGNSACECRDNPRTWRQWVVDYSGQATLALVTASLICFANYKLFRVNDVDLCETDDSFEHCQEQRFLHASLGGEISTGIPYRIFQVLPDVFDDELPENDAEGFRKFGFLRNDDPNLPLGFAKRLMGYERVTVNCALCHVSSYRFDSEETPKQALAGPAHTVDVQGYIEFLKTIADDNHVDRWGGRLLKAIDKRGSLSWYDKLIYRFILIPQTRSLLTRQAESLAQVHDGRAVKGTVGWAVKGTTGRGDSITRIKTGLLQKRRDGSPGFTDFPAIWNLEQRAGRPLYAGGEMRSIDDVMIGHALSLGAPPGPETKKRMADMRDYLGTRQAPKLIPALTEAGQDLILDIASVSRGKKIFEEECQGCHGWNGEHAGEVVPVAEVGTDVERYNSWRHQHAVALNQMKAELGVESELAAKTRGYVAKPLDGIWLRAPYLHNGSVPSLTELLAPLKERSEVFYRGCDIYDPMSMGFASDGPSKACPAVTEFDTTEPGNSNGGHLYGTDLSSLKKQQLIDYLRTL